jgi:hypothetical protein
MRKLLVLALLLGCDARVLENVPQGVRPDAAPPDAGPPVLVNVEITPTTPIVQLDLGATGGQSFRADAVWSDGHRVDVSADANWMTDTNATTQGSFQPAPMYSIVAQSAPGVFAAHISADYMGKTGHAVLTVVALRMSGGSPDFFFVLPYNDPQPPAGMGTQSKPLSFSTNIKALDVFFAMDTTGSMLGEITHLQSSLTGTILPGIQSLIPNTQMGVGEFQDFPVPPYGDACQTASTCLSPSGAPDQPFKLLHEITTDTAALNTAVGQLSTSDSGGQTVPAGNGGDFPESQLEALYQMATGEGISGIRLTNVPPHTSGVGGVGFRDGTLRVIVTITDALFHTIGEARGLTCHDSSTNQNFTVGTDYTEAGIVGTGHDRPTVKSRLSDICTRVVGVGGEDPRSGPNCSPIVDEEDFALASGAMVLPSSWDAGGRPAGCASGECCTGVGGAGRAPVAVGGQMVCPLVFKIQENGSGLGNSLVAALKALVLQAPIDVTTGTVGRTMGENNEPLPAGTTTANFIKAIIPDSATPPTGFPAPTMDATAFHNVIPGTTVRFNVRAYNDFVPPTAQPQLFKANIRIFGDRCGTDLDNRDVFVVVPPGLVQ